MPGIKDTGGTNSVIAFGPVSGKATTTGIPITKTSTKSTNVREAVLPIPTVNGVSASVTRGSGDPGEPATTWWVANFQIHHIFPQNVTSMPEPPESQNQNLACSENQECFGRDMNMVCR